MRLDREWFPLVQEFVEAKDLVEEEVKWRPSIAAPDQEINWQWLKRGFSRNPAIASPLSGTRFVDKHGGFTLDEVRVRRALTSTQDHFVRMGVELPGAPPNLSIRPAGTLRRLFDRIRPPSEDIRLENLSCGLSKKSPDRDREKAFLGKRRRRILLEAQNALDGIYMHGGKLYLIRHRNSRDARNLEGLYDELIAIKDRLANAE